MIVPNLEKSLVGSVYSLDDSLYENHKNVDCDMHIKIDSAYLSYKSEYDELYPAKPYLQLRGVCDYVDGSFPYDITRIKFDEEGERPVNLIYEFSDDELGVLVFKGLYHKDFEVPRILEKMDFMVNGKANLLTVEASNDSKIPLMFADLSANRLVEINENSLDGISIVDLFETAKSMEVSHEDELDFDEDYGESKKVKVTDNIFENNKFKDYMKEEDDTPVYIEENLEDEEENEDINNFNSIIDDAYDALSDEEKEILALREEYGDLSDEDLRRFKEIRQKVDEMIISDLKYNNRSIEDIKEEREKRKREVIENNIEQIEETEEDKENEEKINEKEKRKSTDVLATFNDSNEEDIEFQ